jgi:hypothetical protein
MHFLTIHVPRKEIKPIPGVTVEDSMRGISIVPLQSQVVEGKYGNLPQDIYAERMKTACLMLVNAISDDKTGFEEIMKKAGELRGEIARDSNTLNAEKFGLLRKKNNFADRISTPLEREYIPMYYRILEIEEQDRSMNWEWFSKIEEGGIRSGFRLGICNDATPVQLSRYFFSTSGAEEKGNVIAHTYPECLEKALIQCEFLFDEILRFNSKTDRPLIHEFLAKFHWWFTQATPYFRGSAACGELIVSALSLIQLGYPLKWKDKIYADRIALTSSEEDFVAIYSSLHYGDKISNNG